MVGGIAGAPEGDLAITVVEVADIGAERVHVGLEQIAERGVGAAFEVHLDVVPARAQGEGELFVEVEGQFTENAVLLVGATNIVAEDHPVRKGAGVGSEAGGEGEVGRETGLHPEAVHPGRAGIGEVVAFVELQVAVEAAESGAQAILDRGIEADFVGHDLGFGGRFHEQVRWLAGARRCRVARVGHRAITDVVGQILADEQVVRVIDCLVGFAVGEGACIDGLQLADAPLQGPAGVVEAVVDIVVVKAVDLVVAEIRVREKHPVRIQ